MSIWDEHDLEAKLRDVLDVQSHESEHHFGRPFQTPYQIAIAFSKQYPGVTAAIGKPIGGKGTGQQDSLTQYFAQELTRRIRDGKLPQVEGRFLHRRHIKTIRFACDGEELESSSGQSYDLSMFRLTG